jgi:hypothetical protein
MTAFKRGILLLLCGLAFWLQLSNRCAAQQNAPASPGISRPEIVAIYFPGYHQDDHYDSWFGIGWNEWKLLSEAPTRFPQHRLFRSAWGEFDEADPRWMEKQIALAADHGIDVFLFDWYWYSGVKILNRPLEEGFLHATNCSRLKFALMWANHDWRNYFPAPKDQDPPMLLPSRMSPRDFTRVMNYCQEHYFRQTNYWRVNGKLYFSIFETGNFLQQLGGPPGARRVLDAARQQVLGAGLGGIHFAAFWGSSEGLPQLHEAGFDSVTTYNITASRKATLDRPLDRYTDVVENHTKVWKMLDSGVLPSMPVVTVGWDCTPRWTKDAPFPPTRAEYPYGSIVVSNSPAEFGRLCGLARHQYAEARLRPPGILINAWNEWTEGSVLLPELHYGTGFLDALKKAFQE